MLIFKNIIRWLKKKVILYSNLCLNLNEINHGDVYVKLTLKSKNKKLLIKNVILKNVSALICEKQYARKIDKLDIPILFISNLYKIIGNIGNIWYDYPSKEVIIVSITGTNGKTSVSRLIQKSLNLMKKRCAYIGTLGVIYPNRYKKKNIFTTPDILYINNIISKFRSLRINIAVTESSSIGISQGRLNNLRISFILFTNFSHDHLDYHYNMKNYRKSKFRIFFWNGILRSIINLDDYTGIKIKNIIKSSLSYSLIKFNKPNIYICKIFEKKNKNFFESKIISKKFILKNNFLGFHNFQNIIIIIILLYQFGISISKILLSLSKLYFIEGRMNIISKEKFFNKKVNSKKIFEIPLIIIDYAHTSYSLMCLLKTARNISKLRMGNLICIFGCGGNRDFKKRSKMGKIVSKLSDMIIITNDNPRNEECKNIFKKILSGIKKHTNFLIESDRETAILNALLNSKKQDVIVIAGKGHESVQVIKEKSIFFCDKEWSKISILLRLGYKINIDSRKIKKNEIFFAIKGKIFNGHDYLFQANKLGAIAAVVEHKIISNKLPQIILGNNNTLYKISKSWRLFLNILSINILGSNGKTTTKEMIYNIILEWQNKYNTIANKKNLNNKIGLKITILLLSIRKNISIFEIGISKINEIKELVNISFSNISLINNSHQDHQKFLISPNIVAKENGYDFNRIKKQGISIYCCNEKHSFIWTLSIIRKNNSYLSFGNNGEIFDNYSNFTNFSIIIHVRNLIGVLTLKLKILGNHIIHNTLSSLSLATSIGIPFYKIKLGLEKINSINGRFKRYFLKNYSCIIDDSYNANPNSVKESIKSFNVYTYPRLLILGDMKEIGRNSLDMHKNIFNHIKNKNIEISFLIGNINLLLKKDFYKNFAIYGSINELKLSVIDIGYSNILIKGSRFMNMEKIIKNQNEVKIDI